MRDVSRTTSSGNGSFPDQVTSGTQQGQSGGGAQSAVMFLDGRQRTVTTSPAASSDSVSAPNKFAQIFEEALTISRGQGLTTLRTRKAAAIERNDDERAPETAILARHLTQLEIPGTAKYAALNFLQLTIGKQTAEGMRSLLDTIHKEDTNALEAGVTGAKVLQAMFVDGPLDENTKAVVEAILDKASETHSRTTDKQYAAFHTAIREGWVNERRNSPAPLKKREQAFVTALTKLQIPDGLRAALLTHFNPGSPSAGEPPARPPTLEL